MSNPFGDEEPDWFQDPDYEGGGDFNDDDDVNNSSSSGGEGGGFGAEHILLLIDCHKSMFDKYIPLLDDTTDDVSMEDNDDNDDMAIPKKEKKLFAPMDVAITAAHRLLRMKIRNIAETRTGKRDGVGILLYGCNTKRGLQGKPKNDASGGEDDSDDDEEEEEMHSTHELLELAPPGTTQILSIQECIPTSYDKSNEQQRDLQKEFSTLKNNDGNEGDDDEEDEEEFSTLRQALVDANKIFEAAKCVKMKVSPKDLPDSKSIWIFTNRDNPCCNEFDKTQVIAHGKDLKENMVDIHVMPLPKKDGEFDKSLLYNDLLSNIAKDADINCFDTSNGDALDLEDVLDNFGHFARKVRKYAYVPLFLPGWKGREGDPGIMLDLYSMVRVRQKPAPISVHQEKNTATAKRSSIIDKENGGIVDKKDLHYYAEFCGGKVTLHPDDIATLKDLSRSNMTGCIALLGFRPMESLDFTHLINKSSIAFANDRMVAGSAKAFSSLKDAMERKNVFAVAELHTRVKSVSRMVALIPHRSTNGGLLIVQLPFKEDVREVAKEDIGVADQVAVDAAKNLISKSNVQYEGEFSDILPENPWLKHFFGYLESISLGRPLDEVHDDTKIDVEVMLATARKEIEDFSLSLPVDAEPVKKERKRKAAAVSKPAAADDVMEDIDEEWIEMYKNDEICDKTAPELKAFLKSRGERVGGKKGELVDRVNRVIYDHIFSKK